MKLIVEFTHNNETTRHGIAVRDEFCTLPRHKMVSIIKSILTNTATRIANDLPEKYREMAATPVVEREDGKIVTLEGEVLIPVKSTDND